MIEMTIDFNATCRQCGRHGAIVQFRGPSGGSASAERPICTQCAAKALAAKKRFGGPKRRPRRTGGRP